MHKILRMGHPLLVVGPDTFKTRNHQPAQVVGGDERRALRSQIVAFGHHLYLIFETLLLDPVEQRVPVVDLVLGDLLE